MNDELGGHSRELEGMSLNRLRPSCGLVAQRIDSERVLMAIATTTTSDIPRPNTAVLYEPAESLLDLIARNR
jgi:hypothetical protein